MAKRIPCREDKLSQFWCYAPEANDVFLAGDFNNWDTRGLAMTKRTEGTWTACLELAPGRYEYKFIIDGVWGCGEPGCNDHKLDCTICILNCFGTMNRVIEIGQAPRSQRNLK